MIGLMTCVANDNKNVARTKCCIISVRYSRIVCNVHVLHYLLSSIPTFGQYNKIQTTVRTQEQAARNRQRSERFKLRNGARFCSAAAGDFDSLFAGPLHVFHSRKIRNTRNVTFTTCNYIFLFLILFHKNKTHGRWITISRATRSL